MKKNTHKDLTHQTDIDLMEVISQQSQDIDFLEKKINSLYIWLALTGFGASLTTLLLIYKN